MSSTPTPRICFVSASGQNVFFGEMLDAVRQELDRAGVETSASVDVFPPAEDDLVYVLVPHEFMPLTEPRVHPTEEQYLRTIAFCTEQPGTTWFDQAAAISGHCAVTIDINPLGVAALREKGVEARRLRLGYVPSWDHWGGDPGAARDIDVSFMGGHTERRAAVISRMARFLDGRRASIRMLETGLPHTRESEHFVWGDRRWDELARAQLQVNVHRGELGYFEWLRAVGAIANGCVFVTEHSLGFEPLVPGEHFVSAGYDSLPAVVETLLGDPGRVARIRESGYRLLRDQLSLSDQVAVIADAAREIAAAAPPVRRPGRPARRPAPRPPMPRKLEIEKVLGGRDGEQAIRMVVKHLLLEHRELRQELKRALEVADDGPELTETTFGPRDEDRPPRVSVLLTVYNYAGVVRRALAGVAMSTIRDVEVVIVDDASRDGSPDAVREALDEFPWLDATLIERRHNAGLAAARTLAAQRARAPYVFILDADNTVLPHGIERLADTLDADPGASFAYGILEQLTGGIPDGLVSWQPWDPKRLRYGNFVDAMAMIRRDALLEVGGYPVDRRLYGWEDFALWCAFADAGHRGVQLPEMVASYTSAAHSMISITNVDSAEAWAVLTRRHPFLAG